MTELANLEVIGIGSLSGEPAPEVHPGFLALVAARGWHLCAEWAMPWEDEEGTVYEGFWQVLLYRLEPHGDTSLYYSLTVHERMYAIENEPAWSAILRLADMGWERLREEQPAQASNPGAFHVETP